MSDQKYSCQGCERTDLTLTRNGKVRSHAADGKRVGPDNPACGFGSEWPKESTEFHRHAFAYGDDNHGHSGSFCECGMEEPDAPTAPEPPRPPNPFRDPLPGGVWDGKDLPHDRQTPASLGMGAGPADLAERSTRPAGPVSASDFLDGDPDEGYDDEPEDEGPRYFEARYDGECASCFAHFSEGDMIRSDGMGGWEAQDCCGFGSTGPKPEVPKSVARTLPVVRGRYKLPDPETGKPLSASRSSKYAEGIADSYMLDQWRHRMILAGLVNDPEILEKVRSGIRDQEPLDAVKTRRQFLNDRADEAIKAAGGDVRSGLGTKLHKYTEEIDAGTRAMADVPDDFRPDAEAYRLALEECGFRPIKGLIERSVFCRELNVAGTFDRVLECIRDTEVLDLNGRRTTIHAGEFVIGDVKSGDNIKHPWLEILIQEAIYAHAVNENGVAVQDTPNGPFRWVPLSEFGAGPVREDVGVVMHVPYGSGECHFYAADLITGWRGAQLCQANKEFWKIELPKVPIASYVVSEEDTGEEGIKEPAPEDDYASGEAKEDAETAGAYKTEPEIREELGFDVPTVATVKMPDGPSTKLAPDDKAWDWLFKTATTREEANDVWREAKNAGLPDARIRELVALVHLGDPKPQTAVSRPPKPPADQPAPDDRGSRPAATSGREQPNLTERAHRVTTKAEASAIFREANEKINDMPEEKRPAAREYRDKLVVIMQERLAGSSSR